MLDKKQHKSMAFRYSKQVAYYTLLLFSITLCFLALAGLFQVFFMIGIYVIPHEQQHSGFMLTIFILGAIAITVISFLLPFKIVLKVTDKKGVAVFESKEIYFNFGSENTVVTYDSISKIVYTTVHSFRTGGPPLYRLRIETNRQKYIIQCSFREAWQCRRKKAKPTIWTLCNELSKKTGMTVEERFNSWG